MKHVLVGKILLGILYASIALAVIASAMLVGHDGSLQVGQNPRIFLGGKEIFIEIADTPQKQQRGLGGRETLEPGKGMLFVFEDSKSYSFWMKDMLFPIDIIWFDEHRRIVDVRERVDPSTYPELFAPRNPAKFVLEVSAGFFSENNLNLGNTFEIPR